MFNFMHPKSVMPSRPVATMVVRQSTHVAKAPTVLVVQNNARPFADLVATESPAPPMIFFSVSYKRLEYLNFVATHLAATLVKNGKLNIGKPLPIYARVLMNAAASIAFFIKRRKMPVCRFKIDSIGIRRTTELGLLVVPWSEVLAVHRHAPGLLIAKKNGMVLVPFRCLTQAQELLLNRFVEDWKQAI